MKSIGLIAILLLLSFAAAVLDIFPVEILAAESPARCRVARDITRDLREADAGNTGEEAKFIGIDYSGIDINLIEGLQKENLLGLLKMSGIWVSLLSPEQYSKVSSEFCGFAAKREQGVFLEMPVLFSDGEITSILEKLVSAECSLRGIAIGNEVDRLAAVGLVKRYTVKDYIADYNRMVPVIKRYFPHARIIALELSSFMIDYKKDDPPAVRYKPVFEWLIPFLKASLVSKPDYISVHYYPFTGAQKEWETLSAGKIFQDIIRDLEPYLSSAPQLLIGEFNATYQYLESMVYQGSGGESFMSALILPEILFNHRVAGVLHWSLMEPTPSTLGLYSADSPVTEPLFYSYRMVSEALDHKMVKVETRKAHIEAYAFHKNGKYKVIIVNTMPFFRRNIVISPERESDISIKDFSGCDGAVGSITLPPFSISLFEGSLLTQDYRPSRRFSYADRNVRAGEFTPDERSRAYCSTVADFSEKNYETEHFQNKKYNQNAKIATGGTFYALSSPGGKAVVKEEPGVLSVACDLSTSGFSYNQCGVKLPFVTDFMSDRKYGANWSDGYEKGFLRMKLESGPQVSLELHLDDFSPDSIDYNTHHTSVTIKGLHTVEVPIREFRQTKGVGISRNLTDILKNIADLRIEARQPGYSGNFKIHKIEVCDLM